MPEGYELVDEGSHRYFTMIPNCVWMLGLSADALLLYWYVKRVTGENGLCYQELKTISNATGLSIYRITKARNELVTTLAGAKPLAVVGTRKAVHGGNPVHTVTLPNIWHENDVICSDKNWQKNHPSSTLKNEVLQHEKIDGCNMQKQGIKNIPPKKKKKEEKIAPIGAPLPQKDNPSLSASFPATYVGVPAGVSSAAAPFARAAEAAEPYGAQAPSDKDIGLPPFDVEAELAAWVVKFMADGLSAETARASAQKEIAKKFLERKRIREEYAAKSCRPSSVAPAPVADDAVSDSGDPDLAAMEAATLAAGVVRKPAVKRSVQEIRDGAAEAALSALVGRRGDGDMEPEDESPRERQVRVRDWLMDKYGSAFCDRIYIPYPRKVIAGWEKAAVELVCVAHDLLVENGALHDNRPWKEAYDLVEMATEALFTSDDEAINPMAFVVERGGRVPFTDLYKAKDKLIATMGNIVRWRVEHRDEE